MPRPREAYRQLFDLLVGTALEPWIPPLAAAIDAQLTDSGNGHLPAWRAALAALPPAAPSSFDIGAPAIRIGRISDLDTDQSRALETALQAFRPWRKGPFDFFGTFVDTEWRSDLKWNRLAGGIAPLRDRLVLDIGCGNGYHCWRMAGAGARLAIGIDPFLLYVMQYLAARAYLADTPAFVLPIGIEGLPAPIPAFDTVFSMGVLYHRRAPLDHLLDLKRHLRPGGELVLETLVVEGQEGYALTPTDRYAKMKNVWFIPSPATLALWLRRSGYSRIQILDISATLPSEQRSTAWMRFESLSDFLDPRDPSRTVEGYPAPRRAIIVAEA